ncbi:MAG: hypothetical protein QOE90_1881 [Thermoplasmata archaeon]|nr:hypothetical protein [Thermoplasmata archaeon]
MSPATRTLLLALLLLAASGASALRLAPAAPPLDARALAAACPDAACRVVVAREKADAVKAELDAVPRGQAGVEAVAAVALREGGFPAASGAVAAASPSLEAAILRLYDGIGLPVDDALRARVHEQTAAMTPAWRDAITPLVDAATASALASARIVSPSDRATLLANPALTAMLVSLAGTAPAQGLPPAAAAQWAADRAALARVDRAAISAAAMPLAHAVSHFQAPATTASCDRMLDLPFIVIGGACDDTYTDTYVLQVDQGGSDTYLDNAGGAAALPALALDLGAGDDTYRAYGVAQGAALASAGILYDAGGSDLYNVSQFGQGSGNVGFGMLDDAGAGNDIYESPSGPIATDLSTSVGSIATKASAVGGAGILVDEGGDDRYQQDGLDGFIYGGAEGIGLMLERGGDDTYTANETSISLLGSDLGVFAGPIEISAEADGTAILDEEGGHDSYFMGPHVRQGGQGAAGVGALTLLLEQGGDDAYTLGPEVEPGNVAGIGQLATGQGAAYGLATPPGPALAILDDRAGDDAYTAAQWAQGYGGASVGVLLDEGGQDRHQAPAPTLGSRADGATWVDGAAGVGVDI